MLTVPARLRAMGLLAMAPVVAVVAPSPVASWASLSSAQEPTTPLVGLVALVAWACTAWLTLLVALVAGAGAPGALGRCAERGAARIAPTSVRAVVRVALGTTVALTVFGGTSVALADTRPAASSSLDWPGAAARVPSSQASPGPSLDWATPTAPPAPVQVQVVPRPSVPAVAPQTDPPVPVHARLPHHALSHHAKAGRASAPSGRATVVRPGDSLWQIAARAVGPGATAEQVAQAWPQWWSANRDVIGENPDLIHPGDTLVPPTR